MPRPLTRRTTAALALGGVALASALAGCATATGTEQPSATDSSPAETAEPPASDGGTASASGAYADGDYSATGDYQSPGGEESIDVNLTLEGDVVTDVTVTPNATDGNAVRYQNEFADGIAAEVVGVDIDELQVDKVAGSSLTSDGFNAAVEQIKEDAVA